MNKYLLFSLSMLCSLIISAQEGLSILFVDDADETVGNTDTFTDAIESAGYTFEFFDAEGMGESPSAEEMEAFDLVIWHTSNDGTGLWLWGGDDTVNEELIEYLSSGGSLWLVGLDFMFDRYGVPPGNFQPESFPYDYLGIESYDVQSYGDDGELGVPAVYPDAQAPVSGLASLTWIFETLWWVDGVSLNDFASPVYRMGNEEYVFYENICGAWFDDGNHRALTYFFDLAVAETEAMIIENVEAVLGHFESLLLSSSADWGRDEISVYPNPCSSEVTIEFRSSDRIQSLKLKDLSGRVLQDGEEVAQLNRGINLRIDDGLSNGVYLLEISFGNRTVVEKLVISR